MPRVGCCRAHHFGAGLVASLVILVTLASPVLAVPVTFAPKTDYATGHSPFSAAIGDLNGDNKSDLVTENGPGTVSVLLGTGDGGFGSKTDFETGLNTNSLAIGDLNGDGRLDVVTSNTSPSTVSVLLGIGDGSFGPKTDFATGLFPETVALGDVNGDGKLDLVTANANASTVSVLLGNGDGSFGPKTDFATGPFPYGVAIGDLNGDSKLDLVATNSGPSGPYSVSVLLGTGDGSFGPKTDFATGTGPHLVAIGDLNGDGKLDVVTANASPSTVSVLLGNGDGTLEPKTDFMTGNGPQSVVIADLNGDCKLDLVTVNSAANTVSVLLGTGDGTFGAKTDFAVGQTPHGLAAADLNGDAKLDLVTANGSDNTASVLLNTSPLLTLKIDDVSHEEGNSGTTTFTFTVSLSSTPCLPVTIDFKSADGTAMTSDVPSDYTAVSGTLTILAGSSSATVIVLVDGDTKPELDETFAVNLSNPMGATIDKGSGIGTIMNDDGSVSVPTRVPPSFKLDPVRPNPSTSPVVNFSLPAAAKVNLAVYDLTGRLVRTLSHTNFAAGVYSIYWDGRDVDGNRCSSGMYFIRLKAGNDVRRTSVLLRK